MQHNFSNPAMAARDWPLIVQALGEAVLLDAVQVGSHAQRLRNYWTNLACTKQLVAVLSRVSLCPSVSCIPAWHGWLHLGGFHWSAH